MKSDKSEVLKEFRTLPGVGKVIAEDLWNLGVRSKAELAKLEPEKMKWRFWKDKELV
ncbi:helix-hairpin-helix domain-containing protein [Leptospira sp. WS58.C1]